MSPADAGKDKAKHLSFIKKNCYALISGVAILYMLEQFY